MKNEAVNLKESREGYMGIFERSKTGEINNIIIS